jgi:hypothetical protein
MTNFQCLSQREAIGDEEELPPGSDGALPSRRRFPSSSEFSGQYDKRL